MYDCVHARAAKQRDEEAKERRAEHAENLRELQRHRALQERQIADEERRNQEAANLRKIRDGHSRLLHTLSDAVRSSREAATAIPVEHYLFVRDLRKRAEAIDVANLHPEERHLHESLLEKIDKRLRRVRQTIAETADELDVWIDAVRESRELDHDVKEAIRSRNKLRTEFALPRSPPPRTADAARAQTNAPKSELDRWVASRPAVPPPAAMSLAVALRAANAWRYAVPRIAFRSVLASPTAPGSGA